MKECICIINTTSVIAYKGNVSLLDYTSTKGAVVAFTRGLALHLVGRGIQVLLLGPSRIPSFLPHFLRRRWRALESRTNIFSRFYLTKYVVNHMKEGICIINRTSVIAYKGNVSLLDYTSTKGAIIAFTRGLVLHLGVAPGPIWTPLIPSSFPPEKLESFGEQVSMKRAAQPSEVGPSYVFLASEDSSYYSGQLLHRNGGVVVNA
ncbi:hypothetical protein L7F22_060487 [Adiantum nelumboides]|nr:hypothetical protein [Adiantum nelumboides]